MFEYDRGSLPGVLQNLFCKVKEVHERQTRQRANDMLSLKKCCGIRYGRNCLSHDGPKILNDLKSYDVFNKAKSKQDFKRVMCQAYLGIYADICHGRNVSH